MRGSRFAFSVVIVLAGIVFAQTASAQAFHRKVLPKIELFAEGGFSMSNQFTQSQVALLNLKPLNFGILTTKTSLRTTGRLFTGVRYWFAKDQAIEASYSYSPSAVVFSQSCFPGCGSYKFAPFRVRSNFFAGNYVHTLPEVRSFRPFVTAGAGVVTFFQEPSSAYVKHDPFTADLGGGFDRDFTSHWALRTEFRDWLMDMPHYGTGGRGLAHNLVPSIGPAFRF